MKIAHSARQQPLTIPSTVSLRHAVTFEEEDKGPAALRRGVTFPDDDILKTNQRHILRTQRTGSQSIPSMPSTVTSKHSSIVTSGNRTSPLVSLRTPKAGFHEQPTPKAGFRHHLHVLIMSQRFEMFAGFIILGNFVAIILETDARATIYEQGVDGPDYKKASDMLHSCDKANFAFLLFYAMECLVRLYTLRKAFIHSKWNIFDLVIVSVGAAGEVLELVFGKLGSSNMEHFQVLRSLRMLRLLRAARVIISFKELYSLIVGMSSCLRTLVWAAALVFLMLTMWSIIAVEFLHPYVSELSRNGLYDDCTYCSQSFSNIMLANLTFFQIVSGDGWGELARPLVTNHPWTSVIFVGMIFTMVFGMLNLITAVIVDTAAQAREADVLHMAAQKEYERKYAWENVAQICVGMDADKDGNITFEELKSGTKKIPELNAHLSVMGVEFHDLQMVFDMLDGDQHGKIPINEFVNHLYKMQTHEHKTTHVFVKHYVEEIRKDVKMMKKLSEEWSRQNSEDGAREPEIEPKHTESPPWVPLYPGVDKTPAVELAIEGSAVVASGISRSPLLASPPHVLKQQPAVDRNVMSHQPDAKSPLPDERRDYATENGIMRRQRTCSNDDDLEIGQCIEIENAVAQAFEVLSNAPNFNFASQLHRKRDNTEEDSPRSGIPIPRIPTPQSCHKSPLPTLLEKHQQEEGSPQHQSSSSKC